MLDIYQINKESNQLDRNTIIGTESTIKQKLSKRTEQQSNKDRSTTHRNHTEQGLTQEEKMNIEFLKRTMSEK